MQKNDVYNSLTTNGKSQDDIFIKIHKSVSATVTVPVGGVVNPAEPLVSTDGGLTFLPAYLEEFSEENTYATGEQVVYGGVIQTAKANIDPAGPFDQLEWTEGDKYLINGAAMITFKRENPSDAAEAESFKCAVAVDCEVSAVDMINFNESSRVAGYPNILMR